MTKAPTLEPDRDEIEIFVDAMFRHAAPQGFVSLRAFHDNATNKVFRITPTQLTGGLNFLIEVAEDDARRAAQAPDKVVFCPPVATFKTRDGAKEADIAEGLALSVECDEHPAAARARLERLLGPATCVVKSGGVWTDPATGSTHDKLHLHYRLATPAQSKPALDALKTARNLATRIAGADKSNIPACHPIRWPGSWHRKAEPRLCALEAVDPDREINLDEALTVLREAAPQEPERQQSNGAGQGDPADWPYGKILTGESYHEPLVRLAAMYVAAGMGEGAIVNSLRALMNASSGPRDDRWHGRSEAIPRIVRGAREKFAPQAAVKPAAVEQWRWHFHGDPDVKEERTYLVHDLIPEVGAGLISGQWGTYKTFVALDLAAAVMSGTAFIEFPVNRRGAVLFVACEGQAEIPVRLKAVVNAKAAHALNADGKAPFAWIETCPPLLEPNGTKIIGAMIKEAADRMMRDFSLPVALIVFDTARKAAAQTKDGADNDTTLGQNILKALDTIAREANAFVIGTDHFGKDVSTGTRGASSKEDDSDLVLATLGERTLAGSVTNPRLAIRKRRSGENGLEFPFRVEVVTTGKDDAGRPITTLTISWAAGAATMAKPKPDKWSKSLRLLRQVLVNTLLEHGNIVHPFEDDFGVRAVDLEMVRSEFHRSSTADGDKATKQATRQKAFKRATDEAQTRSLIGVREIKDVTYVWLAEADETRESPT